MTSVVGFRINSVMPPILIINVCSTSNSRKENPKPKERSHQSQIHVNERTKMKSATKLAALLLIAGIEGFTFTAPDTSAPLNLSAPSIEIRWDTGDQPYNEADIRFKGVAGGFTYNLADNISIADGSFTWRPANVSEALQSTQIVLSEGKDFAFEALLHNTNSSAGAGIESDMYSVTGYPYIGSKEGGEPRTFAAATSAQTRAGVVMAVLASIVVARL